MPAMTPIRRLAFAGALLCLAGLVLVGAVATFSARGRSMDASALLGFVTLEPTAIGLLAERAVHLVDPPAYALLCLALTAGALLRNRVRLAAAVPALFVATGVTTALLKQLLAHPRAPEVLSGQGWQIADASFPSGHATAAMTVALCLMLVTPGSWRPLAALAGAAFAGFIGIGILIAHWHMPSDVFGGFFVAAAWVLTVFALAPRGLQVDGARGRALHHAVTGVVLVGCLACVAAVLAYEASAAAGFFAEHTLAAAASAGLAALALVLAMTVTGLAQARR